MQPDSNPSPGSWTYSPEESSPVSSTPNPDKTPELETITWTGSEFLDKHKSPLWYFSLLGIITFVCAAVFMVSKDFLSVGFILVMGILFAIIAGRKPRQLQYSIDNRGIHIGGRSYAFTEFKSFSVNYEGAIGYLNLLPLKRLHPEISVYYPPEEEQHILHALSLHIPHEEHKDTIADKFSRAIRF